jgi:adenylate cyclase
VQPPTEQRVERRLAAIFAADVAGYSRLMGQDEVGTLRTLAAHREIMDGLIGQHRGRIANTAGDSVLAEFPSVVDAVQCAVEVQQALAEANERVREDRRMSFRIGVHVGDVMVRGADLLGDGVNVAARLQALAAPGGVCLSGEAHQYARKALSFAYEDLGHQTVRNMEEPIRAYGVRLVGQVHPASRELGPEKPSVPERPSIAVLPFANMSGDPEQDYFADGVVEEIITALSRIKWFFVIARNSTFTYKGRAVDVKQVGRELGVRYVLEGSIRRAGSRVRIAGQLIETSTGRHVWADRFEGGLEDIFSLQDSITESVVAAIEPSILATEIARARAKPTERLDAYDLYLRALPEVHTGTEQAFLRAERLLRDALAKDPDFPEALSALSDCLLHLLVRGLAESGPGSVECCEAALRAATLGSDNGSILATAAWALCMVGGLHDQGKEFAERALSLQPNSADVRTACGWSFLFCGEPERAQEHFEVARRLNPLDPRTFFTQTAMAAANFYQRRFDHTVDWATRVVQQKPAWVPALRYRAAALTHLGRLNEARADVARLLAAQPSCTVRWLTVYTFRHRWMEELFSDALRRAGLPE